MAPPGRIAARACPCRPPTAKPQATVEARLAPAMANPSRPVIFLTDFGIADDFAGVCHGVVLQRAPGTQVVHLSHGVTPQGVLEGAIVLRNTLRFMPVGVTIAIVDPGVGTNRRALAIDCADGRSFVGPDNGLLVPAVAASGGALRIVSIEAPQHMLLPVSATFHGRDVFAPAAAHLAAGGDIAELGSAIASIGDLTSLTLPVAVVEPGAVTGDVWHVDAFGNVALSVDEAQLDEALGDGELVELSVRQQRYYASVVRTFANVRPGGLLVYVDPYGCVSIAVNQGHAADMFTLRIGDSVRIESRTRIEAQRTVPSTTAADVAPTT